MVSRTLQLSDFMSEYEESIIKNPYRFLGLPEGASLEEVRSRYITLSKQFYPDAVSVRLRKEPETLLTLDALKEAAISYDESEGLAGLFQDVELLQEESEDSQLVDRQELARERILGWAHMNMVILNRAYQEIKNRTDPRIWNQLLGYTTRTVFDKKIGFDVKEISLEGQGEVVIYPRPHDFMVAGPYLLFDFGEEADEPWHTVMEGIEPYYRHHLPLKHLFAYMELSEGKPISRVLLEPLLDCFGLDCSADKLSSLLAGWGSLHTLTENFSIKWKNGIPENPPQKLGAGIDFRDYNWRLERALYEISMLYDSIKNPIQVERKNSGLILTGHEPSIFSEPDYILFLTLAYGPLLK